MKKPLRMWSPIERLKFNQQGYYNAVYKALHQHKGVKMSYQERLRQYEREKSEFVDSGKPYTGKEYEAFIRHLVKKWRI